MKTAKLFIILLAAMPMMMTGCKKELKSGQGSTSNVKFNITDAPANFDALNINVQAIKVHSTTAGWVTLNSQLGTINILSYVNGSSTLAAQGDIAAGTIDQVQLVLGSGNTVTVNGTTYSLSLTPSLLSGLTVNMSGQLQAGGQYTWTFDFDAAQSVTAMGTGTFSFTPLIRLIVDSANLSASGSGSGSISVGTGGTIGTGGTGSIGVSTGTGTISVGGSASGNITGSITPAQLASVCITGSNGSSFCTMTSLNGQFTLQAVGSGSYSVTITPVLPLVSAQTINNVSVTAGATTNVGVVSM